MKLIRDVIKTEFDYETKRWGITPIKNLLTDFQGLELKFFLEDVIPYLPLEKVEAMDLGCGGGNIDAFFKGKFPAWKITGVDVSSDALEIAKKRFPAIQFIKAAADKLPVSVKDLDLVYAFDTIEHFANLESVLEGVYKRLKKGGLFYVAVPLEKQFPSIYWILYKLGWRGKKEFAGHINFFNSDEFTRFLKKHGFSLIKRRFSNHLLFSVVDIAYYLLQSLMGKQAMSFETTVTELKPGFKKYLFLSFKKAVSAVTYIESYIFSGLPGGKGHFLFVKDGEESDFFSKHPPFSFLVERQLRMGMTKFLRPKDLAIKRYLDKLGFAGAKKVLDFGCADGLWLERLLYGNSKKGIGVDIAATLIEKAKARRGGKGNYYLTAVDWPLKQNSVDFCVSFDVFEHIKNKKKEAQKIYETLRPGGKFLIYQLNRNNKFTFDWIFESLGSDYLYKRADHKREIFALPSEFAQQMRTMGFKKVGFELYDGPANLFGDVFCYAFLAITEKILTRLGLTFLIVWIIWLNDWWVRLVFPFNALIDKLFHHFGYSNGFFVWGEK